MLTLAERHLNFHLHSRASALCCRRLELRLVLSCQMALRSKSPLHVSAYLRRISSINHKVLTLHSFPLRCWPLLRRIHSLPSPAGRPAENPSPTIASQLPDSSPSRDLERSKSNSTTMAWYSTIRHKDRRRLSSILWHAQPNEAIC